MRKLAYYSKKDNKFHEKDYNLNEESECKHDFSALKRSNVPFLYSAHYNCYGAGGTEMKSYGLGFGKLINMKDLPQNIAEIVYEELKEGDEPDYGGKHEFAYNIYESENWYGIWMDFGEDDFENEVVYRMFITKDGKSRLYV